MKRLKEWWGFLFGTKVKLPKGDGTFYDTKVYQPPTGLNRGDAWAELLFGGCALFVIIALAVGLAIVLR